MVVKTVMMPAKFLPGARGDHGEKVRVSVMKMTANATLGEVAVM